MVKHGIIHVHSEYSIHDSTQSPEEIVKTASEMGCKHITLTDHGTLLGIDDFMDAGAKYGINTIPGVEMYLENRVHLIMFAKNYEGFLAISRVLKQANENQLIKKFRGKEFVYPLLTQEALESLSGNTNIVVTSACIQGPVCLPLLRQFYLDQSNKKIHEKMNQYTEDIKEYNTCLSTLSKIDDQVKKMKANRKSLVKFTTDTYQKQLEKKNEKIGVLQKECEAFRQSEKSTDLKKVEKKVQQIEKLTREVAQMKENRELSIPVVISLDEELVKCQKQKKEWMARRDRFRKEKNKYDTLKKKLVKDPTCNQTTMYEEAVRNAKYLKELFPHFYLELQNHGLEQEIHVMPQLVKIGKELEIPFIAANDSHMSQPDDDCIAARQLVRYNYFKKHQEVSEADKELYLKTDEELYEALSKVLDSEIAKEALENTKILEECHVVFPKEKHYPTCLSDKSFDELLEDAKFNMIERGEWDEAHEKRLQHEINVIKTMGYVDYHMVVRDFCIAGRKLGVIPKQELQNMPENYEDALKWIKYRGYNTGIGVGPGRGSAAGSLVCYLLGITNLDPLKYNLLFERFLNPERVSMPDIDTDIKTSLRPYIIRYCKQKYGENAVSSIATTSTYAAKAAIQMAGRDRADELYGDLPTAEENEKKREYLIFTRKISDLIPEGSGEKLSDWENEFQRQFGEDKEACIVWDHAKLIEGHVNGIGVHAGGIVISDNNNINDYVPLMWKDDMKVWATQCDMIRVEEKGMLKMDILGLLTLDVISDCVNLVKKNKGISIDLDHLSFEEEVFKNIYSTGRTNSVFQVESKGMKDMLKQFAPTCFEDIILLLAMYRPGPMQFIPNVIAVKQGKKELTYKTPLLEPILKDTYGAVSYQEQVMQLFQILAGYSLGQADMVRRAMSKKKEEKLKVERKAFIYGDEERNIMGCLKNGISEEIANEIFDEVMDFAKYAFNKSHAAAYAFVSYQTAWLKYHYPLEFLCSMFNNKSLDKFDPLMEDCIHYGIEVLPPDINMSTYDFQTEGNAIRYGLRGIKGIADANVINTIVESRKEKPFYSFADFVERFLVENNGKCSLFDKELMEALIRTGCFDSICLNRIVLNDAIKDVQWQQPVDSIIAYFENQNYNAPRKGQDVRQKQEWEMEYLKQCISSNPLKIYKDDCYYGCVPYSELKNGPANIFGLVQNCEMKISAKGNRFLIVHLVGKAGKTDVLFFNERCSYYEKMIPELEGSVFRVSVTVKDGTNFGNRMEMLDSVKSSYSLTCDTEEKYLQFIEELSVNGGLDDLDVFTYYKGYNTESSPLRHLEVPAMVRVKVNKKLIKKLQCQKI